MYATSKVAWRLAEAERELGIRAEYHAIAEVEAFEDHLRRNALYAFDNVGKPDHLVNLTDFERAWILNEQMLIMCDAEYYLTRYAYIKDEQNIIRRFAFRVPQRILYDIIADLERGDRTLEFIILKARQLGCSTLVELLIGHRIVFGFGVNAVIGSADQTKTALMANMLFLMYDYLPVWLRPAWTRRVESERGMLVFGHSSSGVSFQHGSQTSGIARGTTPTIYHLSEVASYTNAEDQIESSLFRCVHPSPSVLGFLESSGEGDRGWWPDTWRSSRDHWGTHGARLCPLFLPWFCGIEMYPDRQWITHDHPLQGNWRANKDTREHVAKCELFVRANPLLERHLTAASGRPAPWRMPREQQWFWEFGHEEAKRKGTESKWFQEMCADDEEALQRSTNSVFGNEVISQLTDAAKPDYEIYGLTGQSIEEDHEPFPDYIDYTRERLPIVFPSPRGERYKWELVPLKCDPPPRTDNDEDIRGTLAIWHHPRPGVSYSIGVDTAAGKGLDSTAIEVFALGTREDPDIQVAEFASSDVNHVEAFAFVLAIAAYYGQHMRMGETRWGQPYVSVEQIESVGDTCQLQMARMGYHNFHKMVRYDRKRVQKGKSNQRGWFTSGWSRPILTTNYVHAVQNGWAKINSPWLIEEMRHYEVIITASGKEKMQHEDEAHDDRIMAAAMACFCPHDLDLLALRSKKRAIEAATLPPIDLGPYRVVVSSRESEKGNTLTLADVLYPERELERWQ
jgi:hypothetical protein